ncbi:MAG: hypothetical protein M1824_004879 [Vezdaea acicularis]|nr:MAG: hypothetical protein M1824_004879 [Vezdaea acicularis]
MSSNPYRDSEETQPLAKEAGSSSSRRDSTESASSASTTSLIFERIEDRVERQGEARRHAQTKRENVRALEEEDESKEDRFDVDLEDRLLIPLTEQPPQKRVRRLLWILCSCFVGAWVLTLVLYLSREAYKHSSSIPHDPAATSSRGSGKQVTMDQIMNGVWRAKTHSISWIEGAGGEDGLLLEQGTPGKDWLVVEDIRSKSAKTQAEAQDGKTLMKESTFKVGQELVTPDLVWPSRDLKHVLVLSNKEKNWRHSYIGKYWIFDVTTQTGQALDPDDLEGRIQLASWSPKSDAVVFTRGNNMFLRTLTSSKVIQITEDGGPELFYGVPDWVFEEEVFQGNSATWWADDGKFIAFLRTNESQVHDFPIEYFLSRPSGERPSPGEESYPDTVKLKYPKAGAPNPTVDLQFYDVDKQQVFSVSIARDFPNLNRLITEVLWAGSTGKVLVRETNRESDILRIILIDVQNRSGEVVREVDVNKLDGGWLEVTQDTTYIPADPANGRSDDGYIDTIIHDGYDHLGYFTPLNSKEPVLLTSGDWEVVDAPSVIDLKNNLVYFHATKQSSIQRHVYSVKIDGTGLKQITDSGKDGYYDASFSKGAGYALLSYQGPSIPWQEVINTPSNPTAYSHTIEENPSLKAMAASHELPINIYSTVTIDGYELNVVERRPPHFSEKKTYPVLFHLYGGPASQTVNKRWNVDFQAFVAANLGYIVVTVDGRGTGFIGREARCIIRGNLGYYEAIDQIETAKIWAAKPYVDPERIAIWGWSYGGFMTLKTLETDAGNTFKYGMAVAPVTDWRFYDSIYTERYMHTPQHNPSGYRNSTISSTDGLRANVRFLIMHGASDDNVHLQNTLTLLDKLDLAAVENYDVHFFPDSDHSIFFHNANRMVYDRLKDWLVNAFNGEWLRIEEPVPNVRARGLPLGA